MVEENAVGGKEAVAHAIILRHPESVDFGCRIRTSGLEWRALTLGWGRGPEHLAAGSLVEPGLYAASPDGLENARGAYGYHIPGILRDIKTNPDVTLGTEMVDLIRSDSVDEIGELGAVGEVSIMKKELRSCFMRININVIYA